MSNKSKKALMYGAGSIGRGFLGQLFSMSGYETCFIDVDESLVAHLNDEGCYKITVATEKGYQSQIIGNVRAINGRNFNDVVCEIASCSVMATAVGVNVLPLIAKAIAGGIDLRSESKSGPLDIIVCENISDGGKYLKDLVKEHVRDKGFLETQIGFVSASVGRMVPVSTESQSSEIIVESYNELPVDSDALKTDVSGIRNFIPVTPFAIEKYKKYFMHNMSHAIVAYLGFIHGCEYLWEAMEIPKIRDIAGKALDESIDAISSHFNVEKEPLGNYADDLLRRYSNKYLNDTVARVGRDPKRKLGPDDRLTGAASFCIKNSIMPEYIPVGIAAAFLFDVPDDVSSPEVINTVRTKGIETALTEYTSVPRESELYSKIINIYKSLK